MRITTIGLLGITLLSAPMVACGIGAQTGVHTANFVPAEGEARRGSFTTYGATIYDKTGIMLAGIGTAASKANAEREATREAIEDGAKVGDTITYTYTEYAPVPGNWTRLSLDIGSGKIDDVEVGYLQADLRTKIEVWEMSESMQMSLSIGAIYTSYSPKAAGPMNSMSWLGMPVGIDVGYSPFSTVTTSGRVLIDPVLGGISYLLGADGGWLEVGARADYRPLGFLGVFADAQVRRTPEFLEEQPLIANEAMATVGLAIIFGDSDDD